MRTAIALISAAIFASPALGFRDTSPLLLWASDPTHAFEEGSKLLSTSALSSAEEVYGRISKLGCEWESVVVVHVDDLHHTHLPSLNYPRDAHVHIPYLAKPDRSSLIGSIENWADKCGAEVVSDFNERPKGSKAIINLDITKDQALPTLPSDLPTPHIMIVTGSRSSSSSSQEKRQEDEYPFPTYPTETESVSVTSTATASRTATATATGTGRHNSTIPTGGPLLSRVQILTTPIITALLVSFGLFIPIAAFGVYALTGIQVPPRMMEIGKGLVVDKGRKDQ